MDDSKEKLRSGQYATRQLFVILVCAFITLTIISVMVVWQFLSVTSELRSRISHLESEQLAMDETCMKLQRQCCEPKGSWDGSLGRTKRYADPREFGENQSRDNLKIPYTLVHTLNHQETFESAKARMRTRRGRMNTEKSGMPVFHLREPDSAEKLKSESKRRKPTISMMERHYEAVRREELRGMYLQEIRKKKQPQVKVESAQLDKMGSRRSKSELKTEGGKGTPFAFTIEQEGSLFNIGYDDNGGDDTDDMGSSGCDLCGQKVEAYVKELVRSMQLNAQRPTPNREESSDFKCRNVTTDWNTTYNIGVSKFLESHIITCSSNEFIQAIRFQGNKDEFFPLYRYEFRCCKF